MRDTVYVVVHEEDGWHPFEFRALFRDRGAADAWLAEHDDGRMRVDEVQRRDVLIHPDEQASIDV